MKTNTYLNKVSDFKKLYSIQGKISELLGRIVRNIETGQERKMKLHVTRYTLYAIIVLALFAPYAARYVPDVYAATIIGTKHNLSKTGPGPIRAQTESQICVFCHTPHRALSQQTPLWNHTLSSASYTLPSSSQPAWASLLSTPIQPDGDSRLCMSCHDGTVAIGSVVNTGRGIISMEGVAPGGVLPPTPPDQYISPNFGTDLSGNHPVSIELNSSLITDKQTQCGSGDCSFEVCFPLANSPIKLRPTNNTYPAGGVPPRQGVQCTSCHDPHNDPSPPNTAFLRLGSKYDTTELCYSCHADKGCNCDCGPDVLCRGCRYY